MRNDSRTDAQLLAATAADPGAFGVFYARHEDHVLRWCVRETRDPELAADLAAETFAAALVSSRRYRPRSAPAEAWLFGIARNVLAMSRRRGRIEDRARRRLGMQPIELTDETVTSIAEVAECPGTSALESLPAEHRRVVRARVIEERSYADIASELRCSEQVVRKRVSRALATLKTRIENGQ